MKTKYKTRKLTIQDYKRAKDLFIQAIVDPEFLKKMSLLMNRELIASKDTEDYNLSVISKFFDKGSILLREIGQNGVEPGDVFRLIENMEAMEQKKESKVHLFDDDDLTWKYRRFPFSIGLSQELRTHFILKTDKNDNFESLIDEVDGLISGFLSIQEWIKLKSLIKKAETRLSSKKYKVLNPEKIIGNPIELSRQEAEQNGLDYNEKHVIDERTDGHDLLALKDLVSILKGEYVHPFSMGPGFFAKYMPEFKEEGIEGIIFKVSQNRLVEIKLFYKEEDFFVDFSPIVAANCIVETYSFNMKPNPKKNGALDKAYFAKDIFEHNTKYFVVVDGTVAIPENKNVINYEELCRNTSSVDAGEVFLFSKPHADRNGTHLATRLYFTPYDYSKLNLAFQHGSLIYGSNDQTFHSCIRDYNEYFDEEAIEMFKTWIGSREDKMYEPAYVLATYMFVKNATGTEDLVFDENHEFLFKAFCSLYEETDFSVFYLLHNFVLPHDKIKASLINHFLSSYSPLTKRFILGKYFADTHGLWDSKNETTYDLFSKEFKEKMRHNRIWNYLSEESKNGKKEEDDK